jgi:hypothetical protein
MKVGAEVVVVVGAAVVVVVLVVVVVGANVVVVVVVVVVVLVVVTRLELKSNVQSISGVGGSTPPTASLMIGPNSSILQVPSFKL